MNTAAEWSRAVANKPQRQKQNVKKERAFLGGKGIYLGSPVTSFCFLSFLNNIFSLLSLTLYLFRHGVFFYFINLSLFSKWGRISFHIYIFS